MPYEYLHSVSGGDLFEKWSCDIVGLLPQTKRGKLYTIVGSEYESRILVVRPVFLANSYEVADFLLEKIVIEIWAARNSHYRSRFAAHG